MKACDHISEAVGWAAQGSTHAVPTYLHAHAAHCAACAELITSVALGRELGGLLPATAMTSARHDAIRFRLMAEARREGVTVHSSRRVQFGVRLLVAALVTTGIAAATKYAANQGASTSIGVRADVMSARAYPHLESRRFGSAIETQVKERLVSNLKRSAPASSSSSTIRELPRSDDDGAFAEAWAAFRAKRPSDAAKRFDSILASGTLDPARRADVLYWSAQSHRQAGEVGAAASRSSQLLRQYPSGHYASDAALILGEYALASDQFDQAAQYLNQAARSERAVVRERAQRALRELVKKQAR